MEQTYLQQQTPATAEILLLAQYEATEAGAVNVSPLHVLLVLVRRPDPELASVFGMLRRSDLLREASTLAHQQSIFSLAQAGERINVSFSAASRALLDRARIVAAKDGRGATAPQDVLMAMLNEPGPVQSLLARYGLTEEIVGNALRTPRAPEEK